jgi:hypothetical protein
MLGGAYAGVVLGHKLAEPDHQSAFERRVQAPGDDPHYVFAGLLGAVIGFVVAGLLVMLLYAWFLARREREGGRRTEDRSNDL